MNAQLNVLKEGFNVVQNNSLIFPVVLYELDEEDVSSLNDFKIAVFVFSLLEGLRFYYRQRKFICSQIPQQSLI